MTIVKVAFDVTAEKLALIETHLDNVSKTDVNWNGADFKIERDEFTCIESDDSPSAVSLLHQIFNIISGEFVPKK